MWMTWGEIPRCHLSYLHKCMLHDDPVITHTQWGVYDGLSYEIQMEWGPGPSYVVQRLWDPHGPSYTSRTSLIIILPHLGTLKSQLDHYIWIVLLIHSCLVVLVIYLGS